MAIDHLTDRLAAGDIVLLDGATGTELERRGARMNDGAWCALVTGNEPDLLRDVHEDYIRAGADVVTANTFSNTRHMLEQAGIPERVTELTGRAVEIAIDARSRAAAGREIAVALSISHQMPMVLGAARDDPARRPSPEAVLDNFREVAQAGKDAGADMIILEMMSRPLHMELAIRAADESGLPYWCGLSARQENDRIISYAREGYPFADAVNAAVASTAEAIGLMHTNIGITGPALAILRDAWDGPMMAYPDSGHFEMPYWRFENISSPEKLVEEARAWVESGVRILGGCCGLGCEHVQALAAFKGG